MVAVTVARQGQGQSYEKATEDLKVALTPTGTADGADYALVGAFDHRDAATI